MSEFLESGLSDRTLTLGGEWGDGMDALFAKLRPPQQAVTIVPDSVTLFGVSWWALRYRLEAKVEWAGDLSAQFTPTDPITIERAEWWRRAVFYVVKYPVRWWQRWVIIYLTGKPDRNDDPCVSQQLLSEDGRRIGVSRSAGRGSTRCFNGRTSSGSSKTTGPC